MPASRPDLKISIACSGSSVTANWNGTGANFSGLQKATSLTAPVWTDVMGTIGRTSFGGYYAYNSGLDASPIPNDTEGIGSRHGTGAAILGFDSHVRWISLREFDQEAKANPGLLHCTPK